MGDKGRNKSTPTHRSSVSRKLNNRPTVTRTLNNFRMQDVTLSERRGERKQHIADRKIRKHWREMSVQEREALTGISVMRGREIAVKLMKCYKEHGSCPCDQRGIGCPKAIPQSRTSSHFWDKYDQERLTLKNSNLNPEEMSIQSILRVLVNPNQIVEYNYDMGSGTSRVLLRGDSGVCVVLDLDQIKIITTYFNTRDDQHSTLRRTDYVNNLQPAGLLGGLYQKGFEKYQQLAESDGFRTPVDIAAPVEVIGEHRPIDYLRDRFRDNGAVIPENLASVLG